MLCYITRFCRIFLCNKTGFFSPIIVPRDVKLLIFLDEQVLQICGPWDESFFMKNTLYVQRLQELQWLRPEALANGRCQKSSNMSVTWFRLLDRHMYSICYICSCTFTHHALMTQLCLFSCFFSLLLQYVCSGGWNHWCDVQHWMLTNLKSTRHFTVYQLIFVL